MICNICGSKVFMTVDNRQNAMCSECGSLERHRKLYYYIGQIHQKSKVLHCSPNGCFREWFMRYDYYFTMDKDLRNLPFIDDYFDFIIASHIFEHIKNDMAALYECKRVLKSGGYALVIVPQSRDEKTIEGIDDGTMQDRYIKYGNSDHVRIYGQDFIDRLKLVFADVQLLEPPAENKIHNIGTDNIYKCGVLK